MRPIREVIEGIVRDAREARSPSEGHSGPFLTGLVVCFILVLIVITMTGLP